MTDHIDIIPSPKNFKLMILGQIISIFGSALIRFALSLYVLDITGREDIYAILFAISNIPILLAPLGGAIADRFNRRNLMVIFDFTSSAIILVYLFILFSGKVSVLAIGAVMVLLAVVSAMYTPAVTASVPLLVEKEKLESANGFVQAVQALSQVAAPVLGGILYGYMGIHVVVALSCAAFALSAIMEMFIQIPFFKRAIAGKILPTIVHDLKEGFVYVVKIPFVLKSMILAAMLNLVLTPYFVVSAPIIFRVTLDASETLYGAGMGLINAATIVGALTIGLLTRKTKINTMYRWLVLTAALFLPMAFSLTPVLLSRGFYPSYLLFIAASMPVAAVMTVISIFILTKVQKKTPNEHLGKVMAIITAVAQCVAPIGQVIYGFAFKSFRSRAYIPTLMVCIMVLVLALFAKGIMRNEVTD